MCDQVVMYIMLPIVSTVIDCFIAAWIYRLLLKHLNYLLYSGYNGYDLLGELINHMLEITNFNQMKMFL